MKKALGLRRARTPSVLQGPVSCGKYGYALSRISTRTSTRTICYYRCLGSEAWRHLNGPVCDSYPNRQRETDLRRRLIRERKSIDRPVNAWQEELITIDELRERTPELRRQEQVLHRELQSVVEQVKDQETYLRLADTLNGFLARLRSSVHTMDIGEQQRLVRLRQNPTTVAARAPCISKVRRYLSPHLEIPNIRTLPPVPICPGVRPSPATNSQPDLNAAGPPIAATKAVAPSKPTPGVSATLRLAALSRCHSLRQHSIPRTSSSRRVTRAHCSPEAG